MLSRLKFEIDPLVNEMLDHFPKEAWISTITTFFDPAIAGGQFVKEVERRLLSYGHSRENVAGRVFGMENNILSINYAKIKHGLIGKYWVGNHDSEINMKFDYIVGNPPFQDGKNDNQANKVWPKFIVKSFDLLNKDGFVCMISPISWATECNDLMRGKNSINIFRDLFKTNTPYILNIDSASISKKYFSGVASSFSWFVVQKTGKYQSPTKIISNGSLIELDISDLFFLPLNLTYESVSILRKTRTKAFHILDQDFKLFGGRKEQKEIWSKTSSLKYMYKNYHTPANGGTYEFSSRRHHNQDKNKVMISLSGKYVAVPDFGTVGYTGMCLCLVFNSKQETLRAAGVLNSKLYRYLVDINRSSGFVPRKFVMSLAAVDLSKKWSDYDLYKHFNLTKKEIKLIEETVK